MLFTGEYCGDPETVITYVSGLQRRRPDGDINACPLPVGKCTQISELANPFAATLTHCTAFPRAPPTICKGCHVWGGLIFRTPLQFFAAFRSKPHVAKCCLIVVLLGLWLGSSQKGADGSLDRFICEFYDRLFVCVFCAIFIRRWYLSIFRFASALASNINWPLECAAASLELFSVRFRFVENHFRLSDEV